MWKSNVYCKWDYCYKRCGLHWCMSIPVQQTSNFVFHPSSRPSIKSFAFSKSKVCFEFRLRMPWLIPDCPSISSVGLVKRIIVLLSSSRLTPNLPFAMRKDAAKIFSTVYLCKIWIKSTFEKDDLSIISGSISISSFFSSCKSFFIRLWSTWVVFVNYFLTLLRAGTSFVSSFCTSVGATAFCSASLIRRTVTRLATVASFVAVFSFCLGSKSAPLLILTHICFSHMKFIVPTFEKRGVTSSPSWFQSNPLSFSYLVRSASHTLWKLGCC